MNKKRVTEDTEGAARHTENTEENSLFFSVFSSVSSVLFCVLCDQRFSIGVKVRR